MKDIMSYKGYMGSVHYSDDDRVFFGKIEYIESLINFEGMNLESLRQAFEEAVDDYLELCREENIEQELPFSYVDLVEKRNPTPKLAYI
jgi:predicted HicB family RNase H-like nuclease